MCAPSEETLREMKSKHPEAELPVLPSGPLPDPVRFDKVLVRKKVEGFHRFSCRGFRHATSVLQRYPVVP